MFFYILVEEGYGEHMFIYCALKPYDTATARDQDKIFCKQHERVLLYIYKY